MFKTELHVHTYPVSRCAHTEPEETAEHYIENGYRTMVITNHFSPPLFDTGCHSFESYEQTAQFFIDGYRRAKKQAGDRMTVLMGMELRVNANMNDYLIYGIDEQFVKDLGNVMDKRIRDIVPFIHERGALIFQAHPFRNGMTVTDPSLLDGIEAGNFCTTHDSRNDIAQIWAKRYELLTVYGSDYHNKCYMRGAGILTDDPITDNERLVSVLKSKSFMVTDGLNIYKPY